MRVTSTADVHIQAPRSADGETRVELLSGVREGETVPFTIEVTCALLGAAGTRVERTVEVRLEAPVGSMNRARPAGG